MAVTRAARHLSCLSISWEGGRCPLTQVWDAQRLLWWMWCVTNQPIAKQLVLWHVAVEIKYYRAPTPSTAPLFFSLLHQTQFQAAQEKCIMEDGKCVPACLYSAILKMSSLNRKPRYQRATGRSSKWRPEAWGQKGFLHWWLVSTFADDSSSHFIPQEQQVMDRRVVSDKLLEE